MAKPFQQQQVEQWEMLEPDEEATVSLDVFPPLRRDAQKQVSIRGIGGNEQDTHMMYLRDVGRFSLLTEGQERELAARIGQGDQEAFQCLVEVNLRLVVSVARRYLGHGIELSDLVQEGNLGLMRAAGKYDGTWGTRFSTYAFWWIHQSISRAIEYKATHIHVPSYAHRELRVIRRVRSHFLHRLGREPQPDELVKATGLAAERIEELLRAVNPLVSLDKPAYGDEQDIPLRDVIPDAGADAIDDVVIDASFGEEFREILRMVLTEREQKVIRLRHGLFGKRVHTLEEVGRQVKVSRERVRQIEAGAIEKLRHSPLLRRLYKPF